MAKLPKTHPLVQQLAAAHRAALEEPPVIDVNPAWSDACYLPRFAGTPGQTHSATESAETWRIVACAQVLAAFLYTRLRA